MRRPKRPAALDRQPFTLRSMFAAFFAAIVSFLASAAYAEHRASAIDAAATSIAENATPSIEHLAATRAEIRRLQALLGDYVNDAALGRPVDRRDIDQALDVLSHHADAYLTLPVYPGEHEQWQTVEQALAKLRVDVSRVLSLAASGRPSEASAIEHDELRGDFDRASDAIMASIEMNAEQAHGLALDIAIDRVRARRIALGLNALSVTLTVIACGATALQVHRQMKLLWSHGLLLGRRADELEQFAGRVAHDVLSPLGAVALALDVTARKLGDDTRAQATLERGRRAVERVKRIVDGLLQFARAGARPEPGARAEVRPVIDDLAGELGQVAEEIGAELRVEPFAPRAVAASPGVLTSLIANLARNALKYLGDADVRRVVIRVLDAGDAVRIEVEDTGPGVAPALEGIVFEPYIRAPGAKVPGTGLGLATVKRLAEAHGGRVGLRTVVGSGSVFWFELPRASIDGAPSPDGGRVLALHEPPSLPSSTSPPVSRTP
jgi:signal transduction histidine kinase